MANGDPLPGQAMRDAEDLHRRLAEARAGERRKLAHQHRRVPYVLIHGVEHKSCSRCCRLRPVEEFNLRARSFDGRQSWCRRCTKEDGDARRRV